MWAQSGVGRYIRNLVAELAKIDKKNEYMLFVRSEDSEEIKSQLSNLNFQLIKADARWHSFAEQIAFLKILNRENCDLVHFPYFSHPIFYNKPFVITIHDLIITHYPTGKASTLPMPLYFTKRVVYNRVLSHALKKSKKIIVPLHAVADDLEKTFHVSKDKIVVTREGIDKMLHPKSNTAYSILNTKYFLYVGNAYPHKNLDRLVDAFSMLCHPERSEGPRDSSAKPQNDISLLLVGKEDYFYKRLKEKVQKTGLENRVLFKGFVSDEELANLYQHAIALVIPSLMEGFGLPVLEAMSNNCLVLASDIPSLREVAADAAVYFDPKNTQDMQKTLREVLTKKKDFYKQHIEKGKKQATMFSWEKTASQTLQIYESCFSLRQGQ